MGMVYSEPACQLAYDNDLRQLYRLLKDNPKNLNVQDGDTGDTPLIAACRRGNVQMVQYLLDNDADATLRNKKQRTCLHYTTRRTFSFLDYLMITILMPIMLLGYFIMEEKQRKNVNLLKTVLESRVQVNTVDYKGNTGLHYACQRKSHRLVPLLLEKNADATIKNNDGETALDISTRLRFKKIVAILHKTD